VVRGGCAAGVNGMRGGGEASQDGRRNEHGEESEKRRTDELIMHDAENTRAAPHRGCNPHAPLPDGDYFP
jgi:hypothetical protein